MTPQQAKQAEVGDRLVSIFDTGNLLQGEQVVLIKKCDFDHGFFAKKNGHIVGTNIQHFDFPPQ